MDDPKITYHVLHTDDTYIKQNSYYAGTYTGTEPLSVTFRIWNNYKGTTDVANLENFQIVARFLTDEDNVLLSHLVVERTGLEQLSAIVEKDAAVFNFAEPLILQGTANTGTDAYAQNYLNITVSFDAPDAYLKDHDLKSLVLEIVEI